MPYRPLKPRRRIALAILAPIIIGVAPSPLVTSSWAQAALGARQPSERIAILPIILGRPGGLSSSALYDAAVGVVRGRLDVSVISEEEIFVKSREGLLDRVRSCGPDGACIASRMRAVNAERAMLILVNADVEPALLSVRLLDTDARRELDRTLLELSDLEPSTVARASAEAVAELLDRRGYRKKARLVVEVVPPEASISLKPSREPDSGAPHVFTLAAGTYIVRAELEDHQAARSTVEVEAGQEKKLRLELLRDRSVFENPWLWIGVSVAAAAAATATIVALSQDSNDRLCLSMGGRVNPSC